MASALKRRGPQILLCLSLPHSSTPPLPRSEHRSNKLEILDIGVTPSVQSDLKIVGRCSRRLLASTTCGSARRR